IEKKPLYHFLPGSMAYSIAAMGCNFKCRFCQNHTLSIVTKESELSGENIDPEEIVQAAIRAGASSVSYTYTEPTIYFELMYETAIAAKNAGLKNVMVSNGFISEQALDKIIPLMDGANIDLKSFSEKFYSEQCGGRLAPVIETIKKLNYSDCWLELTTLLIPELNTSEKEIEMLVSFIAETNSEIPWHVSRFFPHYQVGDKEPTDTGLIENVLNNAEKNGIKYVYGGNFDSGKWGDTRCHECGETLINRRGYHIAEIGLAHGKCENCSEEIPGVWN
ncbi:MAG: AmmeMemoRadiSam system radical SAM enzyme, partial [Candidatus Aminicenantes bacterium]|nr:AmmeMemoRadiSam system radical SAM enzyme [Candidatus Aminicenantes bacterium]